MISGGDGSESAASRNSRRRGHDQPGPGRQNALAGWRCGSPQSFRRRYRPGEPWRAWSSDTQTDLVGPAERAAVEGLVDPDAERLSGPASGNRDGRNAQPPRGQQTQQIGLVAVAAEHLAPSAAIAPGVPAPLPPTAAYRVAGLRCGNRPDQPRARMSGTIRFRGTSTKTESIFSGNAAARASICRSGPPKNRDALS